MDFLVKKLNILHRLEKNISKVKYLKVRKCKSANCKNTNSTC